VHAFPSSQGAVLLLCPHTPVPVSHVSSVHPLLSSQLCGVPATQLPPAHVSSSVHAFVSLHGPVLFVCTHPLPGLQLSSVHTWPSSQSSGTLPAHVPPPHTSDVVHASPSSHACVLFVYTHPLPLLHVSSVHPLLSLHTSGAPTHVPLAHASAVVQAFPSLQLPTRFGFEQAPLEVLQTPASWHWSSAVQTTKLLPVQLPN
jgi:hypothetical protein